MKEVILYLKVLFNPKYWIMTDGVYSREFDKFCRNAINKGDLFSNITNYKATINGKELWIENHPYGSFTYRTLCPSRRTKILLREHLEKSIMEE